jgi:hypothetical protein
MKKILFSAAAFSVVAVSAIAVAPTTSEAIPAFARQTGAACLSCHFQSFPTLSAFGRAFKMGALTDVGDQALIEDEELSIPASLNATIVFRPQIQNQKINDQQNVGPANTTATSKSISYGDQVVLIGGRIGHNAGAFVELGGGVFGNHQLFTSFELGDFRGGINYANTGFGTDSALQLGNTWGQHGGMMGGRVTSANQYLEKTSSLIGQYASAVAWVGSDMGAIQFGLVAPSDGTTFGGAVGNGAGGGTFTAAKIVRANTFFDAGGLTAGVGGIWIGGKVGANGQYILGSQLEMKRWGVEASLEGELGDSQVGLYLDYANARKSTAGTTNLFNTDLVNDLKGFGVRGTIKPLHNLVLMAGYGSMKATAKDTTATFGAEFEVYQNFVISLTFTDQKNTNALGKTLTTKTTLLDIEALL